MKTKKYQIEVTRTEWVTVVLPETMNTEEFVNEWERSLFPLDVPYINSIAKYAAEMASLYPNSEHDGVGKMIETRYDKPDYDKNPFQVVAITREGDVETMIIGVEDWKEA